MAQTEEIEALRKLMPNEDELRKVAVRAAMDCASAHARMASAGPPPRWASRAHPFLPLHLPPAFLILAPALFPGHSSRKRLTPKSS